jgi:hypothetical protein
MKDSVCATRILSNLQDTVDKNKICFGAAGIGRAFHPWDELKNCSCGGYPYMVGIDGKDFSSGSPYKVFCTRCLKSTATNENIRFIKKEWNEYLN